jgi:hypothetical protein
MSKNNISTDSGFFKRLLAYQQWLHAKTADAWDMSPGSNEWMSVFTQRNTVDGIVNTILYGQKIMPLPNEKEDDIKG